MEDLARWLGVGLALVADVFDPELVVIGGGVSESAPLFLDEAREHYAALLTGAGRRPLARIRTAQLGEAAAVVGRGAARAGPGGRRFAGRRAVGRPAGAAGREVGEAVGVRRSGCRYHARRGRSAAIDRGPPRRQRTAPPSGSSGSSR